VWGYAPDYVDAVHRMMQLKEPRDLIICSDELRTVEDMIRAVFDAVGVNWKKHVRIDPKLFRPFETPVARGSHRKITELTGWKPATTFDRMIALMVEDELAQPQVESRT
jgi:GDPmannose 4,6-dehydratase